MDVSVRPPAWISVLAVLAPVLLAGCTSTIHTTVSDALQGDPGDQVVLEQVRVWDVDHTEQELRFTVFDHRGDQQENVRIDVVGERDDTGFIPGKWDWIKIDGALAEHPEPGADAQLTIQANGIHRTVAGWALAD